MSYKKQNFVNDQTLTADHLNYIEDGIVELDNKVDQLENNSSNNTGTSVTSNLPNYWKTRLDKIGEKIEALQMENGMDTLQFLWCSDIHGVPGTSPSNTTYIGDIGRYVMDKYNIPFFIVSGDIMSQASHTDTANIWAEYAKLTPILSPIDNEEFLAVKGNHDGAWGAPMEYNGIANNYYHSYIGDKALFNAFMRRQTLDSHRRVFDTSGMYFYVDYHDYRIYMLNSHTFGDDSVNEQGQAVYNGFKQDVFGSKQLQWIADTLMTVKENQQVIFVAHAPITYMVDKDVFANMLVYYRNRDSYTASIDVSGTYWASGTEYSTSTVTKDFTNAKGDFMGYFNGHIHNDTISMVNIIPMFSITCAGGDVRDAYYTDGTLTREKGTATETAIDVVTVTSDFVYFTRIGSGYDRKFNRATNEVTIDYDSAFIPEEEQPEIDSNEPIEGFSTDLLEICDIKLNQRWSQSSNGYVNLNGILAFSVPFADINGRTIKMIGFEKSDNGYSTWYAYNSSGTAMGRIADTSVGTIWSSSYLVDNGNGIYDITVDKEIFISFNTGTALTEIPDTIYISMYVDSLAIESTDGLRMLVSDINIKEEQVLTQGEITSEVTWQTDKRLSSSSGVYSDLTGAYASSDIPCINGDIIRLYNVSSGVNYNYVTAYGSSYLGFIDVIYDGESYSSDYITASRVDGITTITINHDSVTYIRVCSNGGIDPLTVRITRNQEITE